MVAPRVATLPLQRIRFKDGKFDERMLMKHSIIVNTNLSN